MAGGIATRPAEQAAVEDLLAAASDAPSALLFEGAPGIGKTTVWLAARSQAAGRGFRVLSTRATAAESVLAYTALVDLLSGVDPEVWVDLPATQRAAVDQILSRRNTSGAATDRRAVSAAVLCIIEQLAHEAPVLLAIDDLQWLDPSSAHVLGFVTRRVTRRVALIATVRTEDGGASEATSWLQLPRPDDVRRMVLAPLSSRSLHAVVTQHLGRPVPRARMARIAEISGGNPFYAIELARASDDALPRSLTELVGARIDCLEPEIHEVLLTAACVSKPTVELLSAAVPASSDRVVALLESAENQDIIVIEGNRVRFTHPLLAAGVYAQAATQQRRLTHRRLAEVVDEPELRARHLALAATTGDAETLRALDEAAATAHARGAPHAAAELLELAIGLGGDGPERRMALAAHSFDAGDPGRAHTLLDGVIAGLKPGPLRAEALHLLAVVRFMDDGYREASSLLKRALDDDRPEGPLRVRMLTTLTYALHMIGESEAAASPAEQAVTEAERIGDPALVSQALGVRAMLQFFCGGGIDHPSWQRALELEDHESFAPTMLRPSVEYALMLACTGDLDESYERMQSIQRRCVDKGEEGELVFVTFYVVLNRIWCGDFHEADRLAAEVTELARQLGGEFPAMLSLVSRAWLIVYEGSTDDAWPALTEAIEASKRVGSAWHEEWALTALGFLETSLGNWDAAVNVLEPLLSRIASMPDTGEIFAASFVPDAVEALVALGRAADADPLVDALERNGRRLDRAWTLAVGARCRAMVLAAQAEVDAAVEAAERAMEYHDRLPMPFERARTQLLLGQLQARQRNKDASTSLRQALDAFEQLGTPRWANRARGALKSPATPRPASAGLTVTERRVAELAASGLTNRDVAAALFISAKTVEATLARVYRKLGIRSRAELGRRMGTPASGRR